jgi:hypothetical protein
MVAIRAHKRQYDRKKGYKKHFVTRNDANDDDLRRLRGKTKNGAVFAGKHVAIATRHTSNN